MVYGIALRGLGKALLKNRKKIIDVTKKWKEKTEALKRVTKKIGKKDPKDTESVAYQRGQIRARRQWKEIEKKINKE